MMISKPMLAALKYVRRTGIIKTWPVWIKDGTIRRLRRERYLETSDLYAPSRCNGRPMAQGFIQDKLTKRGRTALRGRRHARMHGRDWLAKVPQGTLGPI